MSEQQFPGRIKVEEGAKPLFPGGPKVPIYSYYDIAHEERQKPGKSRTAQYKKTSGGGPERITKTLDQAISLSC